jgi:hypothetical protein
VFYFQTLLNQALAGIDGTSIISTVVTIAYGILLVAFLIGLYQAAMRGGDVQALAVAAIKYLVIAIIIANWSSAFRDVNNSFNGVAQSIGNSSGAGDMFQSWAHQLGQQMAQNPKLTFWTLINGDPAGMLTIVMLVIAFIVYVLAYIIFCFFYALFGSILYALGPLVLALLPIAGIGQLARAYATNLMIWNAWGLIYSVLAALITAIQVNDVNNVLSNGFVGFFRGQADALILGMVSIFYALAIALIPFIAKRTISGDVGAAAMKLVSSAATAAGVVLAGAAGFAAGAGASGAGAGSSSSSSGLSASSGISSGSSTGTGQFGSSSTTASASSSTAPPSPGLGQSIRDGIASAVSSNQSPSVQTASAGSTGTPSSAGGSKSGAAGSSGAGRSGSTGSGWNYLPRGVAQSVAYQTARALRKTVGRNNPDNN